MAGAAIAINDMSKDRVMRALEKPGEAHLLAAFASHLRGTRDYGDTSSSTRPFVSMANAAVTMAANNAADANIQNTEGRPPAIM